MVSGLLGYTQAVIAGDAALDEPVATGTVLKQALANLRTLSEEACAQIECRELPHVSVQEIHLLRLFQNLLSNALKYRNSVPRRISVHAAREGDFWKLSVRHNGIGISPDHAQQIFGLFKRLHTQEEFAEAGIALALCLKIVQRYGGRIWVESEGPGKGSNFFFTVPGPNWSIAP